MYLQQEQLREENTHHVCELSKRIKEQERDLEQRQGEYEVHVKQTTRENLELKQEQEKHQEGTRETQQSFDGIVHSKTKVCRHLTVGLLTFLCGTHTNIWFTIFVRTLHRHNGYTVQTVYSIPLHCPYPSQEYSAFLRFQKKKKKKKTCYMIYKRV